MKQLLLWITLPVLMTACAPPVHDDPDDTNQVSESNAAWAGSKDEHFEGTHNDFIDDLMLHGNAASGGDLDGLVYSQAPGCAVGVLKNGEITYLQAYGYATETSDWRLDTVAPVASISKTLTAVGVMRMVEEGLVSLDEPIQTYLGNAGVFAGVTLEQLLSMDAAVPAGPPNWSAAPTCPASMPGSASGEWCLSHPRVAFDQVRDDITLDDNSNAYANISIMAAGAVIDQVSYDSAGVANAHRGYEPWIWHQIGHWADDHSVDGELTSLALTHSWRHGDIHPYADGFACGGNCGMNPPAAAAWDTAGVYEGWWGPAGGWSMTIGDLARFVALIDNENVLTEDSWDTIFDARTDVFGVQYLPGIDYGLGAIVENWDTSNFTEDRVMHGGDLLGHSSVWLYSRRQSSSYGVAILCNGNGGEATGLNLRHYAKAITDYAWSGGNVYPELDVVIGFATEGEAEGAYLIDPQLTHLTRPSSLHLPWLMKHDVVIDARRSGNRRLNYTLLEVDAAGRAPTRVSPRSFDLGSDRYTPERFSRTEPRAVTLASERGDVQFNDMSFDLGFSKRGKHLAESQFSAVVDLRQLQSLGAVESWSRLCRIAQTEDDVACQPCDDGRHACLPVTYAMQATRIEENPR